MEVAAYRNGCTYKIWQLQGLAKDPACREYLLREGAVGIAAQLLSDQQLGENSAGLLRCLVSPEGSQKLIEAGGVDRLVKLLSADSAKTREAAALALYHMSAASPAFCTEVFTSMCKAMLEKRGDALVLAALEPLYHGEPEEGLAAAYLLNVLTAGPAQQWPDYFICAGTNAVLSLMQQLTMDSSRTAGVYAASCALTCLAALPVNQPAIVQELLSVLQRGNESGKQQTGLLLWRLLNAGATASTNPAVAAQCAASHDLVPGISWALHAQSWAAAGIVQALTYDGHRVTNSVTKGPDSDAIRLRIVAPEANVIPQLITLLGSQDTQAQAAAAHALANLTAYRSGSCEACSKAQRIGNFAPFAQQRGQAACPHQPQGRVLNSTAPSEVLRLLMASNDSAVVSACVAAISNLCATEEGQSRVHDEAKRAPVGMEGVKARLLQLVSGKVLSVRCQDAARNVLVRLESHNRKAPPISLMTLLLQPPTPVPAFPEP
ncbi:g7255 [Coccomyxa elongata]